MTDSWAWCIHKPMDGNGSPASDSDARAYAEAVVKRSGTSFYWAMRRLPEEKRNAMYAVYAFCREVDDIADGTESTADKLAQLAVWRQEVENLYAGLPGNPVCRALAGPVARFGLRKEDFQALIDGMEMDSEQALRIRDMNELRLYCDRVACAVGRLSIRVFGVEVDKGDKVAAALGEALQLTNILRDVQEDAERDRLYLPADMLEARGIPNGDVDAALAHSNLADACDELGMITERRFAEAEAALAHCDRRKMRPAVMMMEVYRRIFRRLRQRGWRRIGEPVKLSKLEKLWVLFRYGMA